jgi:hypothetical protein
MHVLNNKARTLLLFCPEQACRTPHACTNPCLTCHPTCRGDVIQIETWFQEDGKLAAQRDWRVVNKNTGQELGRATSTWVMINMQTRRLTKMPKPIREKCEAFQLKPPRHAIPRGHTRQKLPDVDLPAEVGGLLARATESLCYSNRGWVVLTLNNHPLDGFQVFAVPNIVQAFECAQVHAHPLRPCSPAPRRSWASSRWRGAPTWT